MKYKVFPAAREDILKQYRYYLLEQDVATVADRFVSAVEDAMEELARHPSLGSRKRLNRSILQELRTWPISGFPAIRLYYHHTEDSVHILRVLHSKRDISALLADEVGDQ